ncbi:MAG: branched-chain amino acid ABC transporter ATP-binding protein/permease [Micromonosporaceae bacterium]|nr:branched-chain amino acid ABC transporter ATP-binding protein/permease [Micromonosporaceae bacterium]
MRKLAVLVVVAVALGIAFRFNGAIGLPEYDVTLGAVVLFWAAQATSWNILSGYAGYFSFGQGAYVAVGAYAMAVYTGRHGGNFLASIVIGGVLGGVLAAAVGFVAFWRSLRGEIFALLTLAVPFILAAFARINGSIDGGQGTTLPVPSYPDWLGSFQQLLFLLNLVVATLAVGAALAIHESRFGRGLSAIHDGEDAAEVLGVPTLRYKMLAIVCSGVLGGLSGAVFGMQIGHVAVESVFGLTVPLFVIVISVLGGRRHWLGPVVGALLVVVLQDRLTAGGQDATRDIILGALLAALVVVAPAGLYGRLRAHPWWALFTLVLVYSALSLTDYWDQLDMVLYSMLAAAGVSIVVGWLHGRGWLRRRGPSLPAQRPAEQPAVAPEPPAAQSTMDGDRVLVDCQAVTRDFGGVRALEDVTLKVRAGEIVGLVGPNGSGKTTLVNLLSGVLRPTRGRIRIAGASIGRLAPHRVAHTGVARTYQIPKPFASMTVLDNVAMAVMFGRRAAGLHAARTLARQHLATVRLEHLADAHPAALNLHQRQLLEMARAIAAEPAVLLLDEALAGLNPAEIDDAVAVIRRIHHSGVSIVIVEHLLRVLSQLATRIVVLNHGVLIADGEPAAVLADPVVVRAYLGRQRA